jgi:hypothetical protein
MSLNNREFLIWKERSRVRERDRGSWPGQQTGIFKVRLGLGETEGRDRDRDLKTKRQS